MKKLNIVWLIVLLIGPFSAQAQQTPPLRDSYKAEQVSEHVYVIHGPVGLPSPENQGFMNNPAFVLTDAGVVVIDPGSSVQTGQMVLEQIKAVTDQPVVASFATHIHGDHWLGNHALQRAYPDVKLYAHANLIEQANNGEGLRWVALMDNLTDGATAGTRAVVPDLPVKDGEVISIGGIDFQMHAQKQNKSSDIDYIGKAHTDSDIALVVGPDNTLFTGDLVFNSLLGRMDDGNFMGLLAFLDNLIGLQPNVVVPGHGQTGDVSLIEEMYELNHTLYQTVEQHYEEGLTDFEIKPLVMEALEDFADWTGFEQSIGRIVSLCYLEVEQNSF